jgi:hypothetical protein
MVHGNIYGIQYEIYLSKPLDLYNDVLPMCTQVRKMIKYEESANKLVLISYGDLSGRFYSNPLARTWAQILDINDYEQKQNPTGQMKEFYDVKIYSGYKHEQIEPIGSEELNSISKKINKLEEINGWTKELYELHKIKNIQSIVQDSDYFNKVKSIEESLTNVVLTAEEDKLIEMILSNELVKSAGVISSGINLYFGFY